MLINVIKKMFEKEESPTCGESHDTKMDGMNDIINSKEIIYFEYTHPNYYLKAEIREEKTLITFAEKNDNPYEQTAYRDYRLKDASIFETIQAIIDQYEVSKDNGRCISVDGLPGGLGDKIEVKYKSGESIYKSSNQCMMIKEEASNAFYTLFKNCIKI